MKYIFSLILVLFLFSCETKYKSSVEEPCGYYCVGKYDGGITIIHVYKEGNDTYDEMYWIIREDIYGNKTHSVLTHYQLSRLINQF